MSDTTARLMIGTVAQWHSHHGTGVVYTGVAVPLNAAQVAPSDGQTPMRVTVVQYFSEPYPTLPDTLSGRTVDSASVGAVWNIRNEWLCPVPVAV